MKHKFLALMISSTFLTPVLAHEDIKHEQNAAYVWDSYGNIVRDRYDRCVRTIDWKQDIEACGGEPKAVAKAEPKTESKAEAKPEPKPEQATPEPKPAESNQNAVVAAGAAASTAAIAAAKAGKPLDFSGFFENNGHDLTDDAKDKLDKYAAYLKDHPNKKLEVTGHTDSKGRKAYNEQLSQKRADKVKAYLVEEKGIESDRIKTFGKGEAEPIADNATTEGRAKNRRVEIQIVD